MALKVLSYGIAKVRGQLAGMVVFYDDDDEEDGAIIYYGAPLRSEYTAVPLEDLGEATQEEADAWVKRTGFEHDRSEWEELPADG